MSLGSGGRGASPPRHTRKVSPVLAGHGTHPSSLALRPGFSSLHHGGIAKRGPPEDSVSPAADFGQNATSRTSAGGLGKPASAALSADLPAFSSELVLKGGDACTPGAVWKARGRPPADTRAAPSSSRGPGLTVSRMPFQSGTVSLCSYPSWSLPSSTALPFVKDLAGCPAPFKSLVNDQLSPRSLKTLRFRFPDRKWSRGDLAGIIY